MDVLETERLIIRPWCMNDVNDFYEYAKNPDVGPNAGWKPHESREESLKILQSFIKSGEVWAVVYKENGKVIGSLGLHKDEKRSNRNVRMIGYVLSKDYWGRGLMPEAVKCAIKYAFEKLDLDLVSIYHYPFNNRSRRVIEKCGFKYEGTIRLASTIYNGKTYDDVCYSITRDKYFNK